VRPGGALRMTPLFGYSSADQGVITNIMHPSPTLSREVEVALTYFPRFINITTIYIPDVTCVVLFHTLKIIIRVPVNQFPQGINSGRNRLSLYDEREFMHAAC